MGNVLMATLNNVERNPMRLPEVAKDRRAESNMYTTNVATPIGFASAKSQNTEKCASCNIWKSS